MATVLSIVTDAMVEIGAYAPGETLSAVHQQLGLLRFQNQLDAWQADSLALNLQTPKTFALTSGTSEFTIGPTGNIVTQRPVGVEGVTYVIPGTTPVTEVPLAPMDDDQFMAISQKQLPSSLPQMYHLNATTTNATMFIWPEVTQNVTLVVYLYQGIDVPATITTVVTGPQGYAEAFMYQLAMRLCGPMMRPMPPALPSMARDAYARIQRVNNVETGMLSVDAALMPSPNGSSAFNVLTGQSAGPSN